MKLRKQQPPTYYVTYAVEAMVAVDDNRIWAKEQLQLDAVQNARIDSEWLRLLEACDSAKQACWSLFVVACKYRNLVIRLQHRKHAFWNRLTKPLRGTINMGNGPSTMIETDDDYEARKLVMAAMEEAVGEFVGRPWTEANREAMKNAAFAAMSELIVDTSGPLLFDVTIKSNTGGESDQRWLKVDICQK